MVNSHEEADVIVVNQVMSTASRGYKTIHIVCDDTDVFVLLVHFYKTLNITSELLMLSTGSTTRKQEGNVLFNDALNTFYLRLYGVRHMVKNIW